MGKSSAWIVFGKEPNVEVLLVNSRGTTLARLPRRWGSLGEAQAAADRLNKKAKR